MVRLNISRSNLGRIQFLRVGVAILFVILTVTIFYRQYLEFVTYNHLSQKQCLRRILYPGLRGTIYDRAGRVLATHKNMYVLYVDLNYFRQSFESFCKKNKDVQVQQEQLWALVHDALLPYAKKFGPIPFQVSPKKLLQHYRQNILLPLALSQKLPEDLYAKLLIQLPTKGPFNVGVEKIRYYPYGHLACHVLGFVTRTDELTTDNLPGNDLRTFFQTKEKGRTGIEAFYDNILSGYNGGDIWRVTPSGQEQACLLSIPSIDGTDVTLTLDIELQRVCEAAMGNYKGSISVVDINQGGVLAMVSKPDFDLNRLIPYIDKKTFREIDSSGAWLNRAIQGLYPPGSTFKLVSFSALLRHQIIKESSSAECLGAYRIGNRLFRCHKHSGHGLINTVEAIQTSCNPFVFKYGIQLGGQRLYDEACFYFLNVPSGIDLPYETRKICIPSPQWKYQRLGERWSDGDTANMLIGQGYLLVTPLKMACLTAALSQNRNVFIPHLVKPSSWNYAQAMSPTAWSILKKGMIGVGRHYIPFFPTALKTGTAQVKIAGENGYRHIGWMVGFAPVNNPQIAFCIEIEQDNMGDGFWGGQICAPVAQKFLRYYFKK